MQFVVLHDSFFPGPLHGDRGPPALQVRAQRPFRLQHRRHTHGKDPENPQPGNHPVCYSLQGRSNSNFKKFGMDNYFLIKSNNILSDYTNNNLIYL